jgi:hypothetical protein
VTYGGAMDDPAGSSLSAGLVLCPATMPLALTMRHKDARKTVNPFCLNMRPPIHSMFIWGIPHAFRMNVFEFGLAALFEGTYNESIA